MILFQHSTSRSPSNKPWLQQFRTLLLLAGGMVGTPLSAQDPSYVVQAGSGQEIWQTVGRVSSTDCAACLPNNPMPAAQWSPIPPQPTGATSGACQACIQGIDCANHGGREQRWADATRIDFQPLLHGEYIGPVRLPAMIEYRIRVGDELQIAYLLTREPIDAYKLQVGDEVAIRSVTDAENVNVGDITLSRGVAIQSDGKLHLNLIDSIPAVGRTIPQLRTDLEKAYKQYVKTPSISVIPIKTNTRLTDLRDSVVGVFAQSGQNQTVIVNPDGRINLQGVGAVNVLGLTTDELKRELNLRYSSRFQGVEVEVKVTRQSPKFIFVYGEVNRPARYELQGPTTVTQALAMAEGIRVGGNHRQIVIFRREADWRLVSTVLDLRGTHLGKRPDPSDQIWLRDSDLIIVPPTPIRVFDNFVQQVFTQGIYGIVPFSGFSIQQTQ